MKNPSPSAASVHLELKVRDEEEPQGFQWCMMNLDEWAEVAPLTFGAIGVLEDVEREQTIGRQPSSPPNKDNTAPPLPRIAFAFVDEPAPADYLSPWSFYVSRGPEDYLIGVSCIGVPLGRRVGWSRVEACGWDERYPRHPGCASTQATM